MNACPSSEQLAIFLAEELEPGLSVTLENHIESCSTCQHTLAELSQATNLTDSLSLKIPLSGEADLSSEFLDRMKKNRPSSNELSATWPKTGEVSPYSTTANLPSVPGYEVLDEIGRGGMGVVFKARHIGLNRLVALKMLPSIHFVTEDSKKRFHREAQAIGRLHHASIVQIFDFGETDSGPFLSLELVKAGSLAQRLDGTPWKARDAANLVARLASAVQYAHEQGVIHRDLKPANVLIELRDEADSNGNQNIINPKISDFGLAKCVDESIAQTPNGTVLGTPSYLAPEQVVRNSEPIGPTADVYGLGAILYELLTGTPPFRGESVMSTLLLVTHQEPIPPSKLGKRVPRDLETICLKCLEKSSKNRYSTAGLLADDLQRFLANESIIARPPSLVERSFRWVKRNPVITVLIGVVFLVLFTAGSGMTWLAWDRKAREDASEIDRRTQTARIERELQQSLQETRSLYDRAKGAARDLGLWTSAANEAKRTEKWAEDQNASPELCEQAKKLRLTIEQEVKTQRLIFQLLDIQASMGDDLLPSTDQDFPGADAKYRRAFLEYDGMDVDKITPQVCADKLRSLDGTLLVELAASLDNWGYVRFVQNQSSKVKYDPNRLHAISRLLDPDPLRNQIRTAIEKRDRKAMLALAQELDPAQHSSQTVNLLGLNLYWIRSAGDFAKGIAFFQKAQSAHSKDFQINHNLAFMLMRSNRGDEAVPYTFIETAIREKSAVAWQDRAEALRASGRDDEAIEAYRRISALAPRVISQLFWSSYLNERLGEKDAARADCREAAKRIPKYEPRRSDFFVLWKKYDLIDEVIEEYRKTLASMPKDDSPESKLKQIDTRLGFCNVLNVQSREADIAAEYEQIVQLDPKNSAYYQRLGYALTNVGKNKEAIVALNKSMEINPKNVEVANILDLMLRMKTMELTLPWLHLSDSSINLIHFADRLRLHKERNLDALKLYQAALTQDPKLESSGTHRLTAARIAALVVAGKGLGGNAMDATQRTQYRKQALTWLQADLAAREKALEPYSVAPVEIERDLKQRPLYREFALLRDEKELAKLPEEERIAWTKLWSDTDHLAQSARARWKQTDSFGFLSAKVVEKTHSLKMIAGTIYRIDMESPQFDTILRLEDSQNQIVASQTYVNSSKRHSRIVITALTTGYHHLIASSVRQQGAGTYSLTVREFVSKAN